MKKRILLGIMVLSIVLPLPFWATRSLTQARLYVYLYDAGQLLALSGFVFLFIQFVLSAKIKWIERDIGHDQLIGMHRTSGIVGLTLILIHPVLLFASDIVAGYGSTISPLKLVGVFSLLAFVVAAGAAILYQQLRLKYETWKAIHWANYVALPLGFVHSLLLGSDLIGRSPLRVYWLVLAALYVLILIHRLWRWVWLRRHPFRVADVIQETHDTCSLFFEGQGKDYKPGQFLFVQLVRDGRVSEPHPFTISSSPTQERLSISVKSLGDFTETIRDTKVSDRAYIDAPYGAFTFLNHDAQDLVFIAGGIGITPFMSMIRYLYDSELERNVVLIWGNKTEQDIAFRDELGRMETEMRSLRVVHVLSNQDDWPGEKGYVDTALLHKYVGDLHNPQVFICGPPIMRVKVVASLQSLGIPKQQIHYEIFALR